MIKEQIDPLVMHTDSTSVPKVFVSSLIHVASNNYWLQSTNGSICCVMTVLVPAQEKMVCSLALI